MNLSNENLHLFKNVFIGTIFKPKKNNGSYRFPNQEKFVYLIQLDTNEPLGPVFYESKVFDSFEEAENDRWLLKSKIQSTTIQEIKKQEQIEESQTNSYYYFNLSKQLYNSGSYNQKDLKKYLALASTKDISSNSKAWVLKTMGTVLLEEGEYMEAKKYFLDALRLNPNIGVSRLLKKCEM